MKKDAQLQLSLCYSGQQMTGGNIFDHPAVSGGKRGVPLDSSVGGAREGNGAPEKKPV